MIRMGSERSSPGRNAFDLKVFDEIHSRHEALDVFGATSNGNLVTDGWEALEIYQAPECFGRMRLCSVAFDEYHHQLRLRNQHFWCDCN
ncbi:hypothetical protein MUK42_36332 [Musa troglodytarum]|uniref:Uncharacterized protein n=1 Tax=Musa troglodytarum TaxID=320322 RepID=A0A9E7E7Z1_9LILI|nr:hypothetical protein MUK42_36332 [Musa troglodytarum]